MRIMKPSRYVILHKGYFISIAAILLNILLWIVLRVSYRVYWDGVVVIRACLPWLYCAEWFR
jgi:hypothetical protein